MFLRRYIIAITALLLPVVIQAILCKTIPSTSSALTSIYNTMINRQHIPAYKLDISNYGNQRVPYSVSSSNKSAKLEETLLQLFENRIRNLKQRVEFINTGNESVDDYVYSKRLEDLKNLVSDYFVGLSLSLNKNNDIEGVGYYSSLALHSAASILNEIGSLLLAFYSNNPNRSIQTINSPVTVLDNSTVNLSSIKLDIISCIETMPFSFIDFIDAMIVAFMISVCTIHVTREKINGCKFLQLLSGAHYTVYWLANYLFDMAVFIFNIVTLVIAIKVIAAGITDNANDVFILSNGNSLIFLLIYMFFASFSWTTSAYVWSFLFKKDITAFLSLFLLLGLATFVDMILALVKYFTIMSNSTTLSKWIDAFRVLLAILFPNVNLKRVIFNLKLRNTENCFTPLNLLFDSII
jgi:hypothetical protein